MNRHLINYSALPTDALGPPMRTEPTKPADGAWKPLMPGYEVRTLAGGAQEVRCVNLPSKQEKPASLAERVTPEDVHGDESAPSVTAGVIPEGATHVGLHNGLAYKLTDGRLHVYRGELGGGWGLAVCPDADLSNARHFKPLAPPSAAPIEWQSGAPPSAGWWLTRFANGSSICDMPRYFGSEGRWGSCAAWFDDLAERVRCMEPCHKASALLWRGPRLTGADWPEPEAA